MIIMNYHNSLFVYPVFLFSFAGKKGVVMTDEGTLIKFDGTEVEPTAHVSLIPM